MNNIYLWLDGIAETFENVTEVKYDGRELTFISDGTDVELKGVGADTLFAPANITITHENYRDYILKPNVQEELTVEELNQKVEELTALLEFAVNNN